MKCGQSVNPAWPITFPMKPNPQSTGRHYEPTHLTFPRPINVQCSLKTQSEIIAQEEIICLRAKDSLKRLKTRQSAEIWTGRVVF